MPCIWGLANPVGGWASTNIEPPMEPQATFTLAELKSGKTKALTPPAKIAVFGDPVEHSLSPQLHNPALAAAGIDAQYIRLHITEEEFPEALQTIRELGFVGINCTIPHKFNAIGAMDEVDDLALKLGAVNTVVFEDDQMIGFNSDGPGFIRAIREEFNVDLRDLRVLILGAGGGAGRAVATQCAVESCERLVLVNRTAEKAEALKDDLAAYFLDERLQGAHDRLEAVAWEESALAVTIGDIDLIVNATSCGMKRSDPALLPSAPVRAAPSCLRHDLQPAKNAAPQRRRQHGCPHRQRPVDAPPPGRDLVRVLVQPRCAARGDAQRASGSSLSSKHFRLPLPTDSGNKGRRFRPIF